MAGQTVPPLYVLLSGGAGLGGLNPEAGGTVTCSDGLGDSIVQEVVSGLPWPEAYGSSGKHLVQMAAPSGAGPGAVLSLSAVTLSAGGTQGNANLGLTGTVDSRADSVSSSLGQTYHKGTNASGQPVPQPDVPASDGTVNATTVQPATTSTIIYYGHAAGSWAAGSSFLMHLSSGDPPGGTNNNNTGGGTFTLPDDPLCSVGMTYGSTATSEHAYLHLTDANDGANATANCYVTFHPQYDQWQHATTFDRHPIALTGGFNDPHPDWTYLMTISNRSAAAQSVNLTKAASVSVNEAGTISGQQSLGPLGLAAFQANESITVGKTVTYTYTTSTTLTGAAHETTQFYGAMSYENRSGGTVDVYGSNGYQGTAPWTGTYSSGQTSLGTLTVPDP